MRQAIAVGILGLLAAPAYAGWREATSEHFIVYSDGGQEALVSFTQRVEKFDQVLRIMTGTTEPPSPVKLRIFLVENDRAVHELYPSHLPIAEGFYAPGGHGAFAVVDRARASDEFHLTGELILYHEYCHHFMSQYFRNAYPVWYQEGFAEYFSTTTFNKDGSIDVGKVEKARIPSLDNQRWLRPAQLLDGGLEGLTLSEGAQFYAQSWLLTHYLFDDPKRHAQLHQYLLLRTQGVPHAEALQRSFGVTDEQLATELRAYFVNNQLVVAHLTIPNTEPPQVSVRELSQSEDALLLPAFRIEMGVFRQDRNGLVDEVRRKAAHFTNDEYAQTVLAEAEARYGDAARALDLLRALVERNQANRRALLDLAGLELSAAQPDETTRLQADRDARKWAVKANRLMPKDPEALLRFYESFLHEPGGPVENAVDGLLQAYLLYPQSDQAAVLLAAEQLRAKNTQHALNILNPIAYAPHGGPNAKRAQQWIEQINNNQLPDFSTADSSETSASTHNIASGE